MIGCRAGCHGGRQRVLCTDRSKVKLIRFSLGVAFSKGVYGTVYKAENRATKQQVAVKKIKEEKLDSQDTEGISATTLREVSTAPPPPAPQTLDQDPPNSYSFACLPAPSDPLIVPKRLRGAGFVVWSDQTGPAYNCEIVSPLHFTLCEIRVTPSPRYACFIYIIFADLNPQGARPSEHHPATGHRGGHPGLAGL